MRHAHAAPGPTHTHFQRHLRRKARQHVGWGRNEWECTMIAPQCRAGASARRRLIHAAATAYLSTAPTQKEGLQTALPGWSTMTAQFRDSNSMFAPLHPCAPPMALAALRWWRPCCSNCRVWASQARTAYADQMGAQSSPLSHFSYGENMTSMRRCDSCTFACSWGAADHGCSSGRCGNRRPKPHSMHVQLLEFWR